MSKKYVALTFDDGPNLIATPRVLDRCERFNIVASFFVNGKYINDETGKVMQRADKIGCEICNHSQNHLDMTLLNKEQMYDEFKKTDDLVYKYIGKRTKFFRAPFIRVNETLQEVVDLPNICGVGSDDWKEDQTSDETASIILSNVTDGNIILLHDSFHNSKTAFALEKIVPALLLQEYEFVTVSKLFNLYGVTPNHKFIYSNAKQKNIRW